MKRKCLAIGISIIAVVLLILTSLTNVVGYQTLQLSNQQIINEEINQKELLFQTIVDIANNKEIQRIILKSQISRGIFPTPDVKFSLTKNQLKQMFIVGLILSKFISKSRMQSIVGKYQFSNQMQTEISIVIEKDTALKGEITQLSYSECDCENENTTPWRFPVLCTLLFPIFVFSFSLSLIQALLYYVWHPGDPHDHPIWYMVNAVLWCTWAYSATIGYYLDCFWYP